MRRKIMRRIMRRKMRTTFFISSRSAKIPLLTTDDRVDQRILDLRRMGRSRAAEKKNCPGAEFFPTKIVR